VAVINYRFSGEPMTVADRLLNPLGFQVVRYRKDEEALPPADLATPDVQAASAASQTLMSQSPAPGAQTIVSRPIYAPAQAVPSRGP
jgi:type IV secretion system protein VirB8